MKAIRTYYRVVEKFDFHDGVVVRYNILHDYLRTFECAENWLKTYRSHENSAFKLTYFIEEISVYIPENSLQHSLF